MLIEVFLSHPGERSWEEEGCSVWLRSLSSPDGGPCGEGVTVWQRAVISLLFPESGLPASWTSSPVHSCFRRHHSQVWPLVQAALREPVIQPHSLAAFSVCRRGQRLHHVGQQCLDALL